MYQLRNDYSLTCPPLYIARYSFIQLSGLGRRGENDIPKLRNGSNGDSSPGSLDFEFGILPLHLDTAPCAKPRTSIVSRITWLNDPSEMIEYILPNKQTKLT